MAYGFTAEERAELDDRARAILEACPDVGTFIRRGLVVTARVLEDSAAAARKTLGAFPTRFEVVPR